MLAPFGHQLGFSFLTAINFTSKQDGKSGSAALFSVSGCVLTMFKVVDNDGGVDAAAVSSY